MSSKRAYSWLAAVLILAAGLLWMLASNPVGRVETDIMALLPKDRQNPVAQTALDRVTGALESKVLFLISAREQQQAVKAASDLFQGLEKSEIFKSVSGRLEADQQQAWSTLYFPKRFQLLTSEQRARLENEPEKQAARVQMDVFNPFSGVTGGELATDPFLLFREFLSGLMEQTGGSFELLDGFPGKQADGKFHILITAETAGSAFDLNQLDELFALENQVQKKYGVELNHTGVLFYAAEGISGARREIGTIGIGSLIGVLLLLIVVYRSPLPIGLSLLSIGCGLLAAFTVTLWVFGSIHLFSLVFGASLIGISIDYAFHYLTHRLGAGAGWNPESGLRAIFPAITVGLITSLMGYAGLLAAPFPGLQQLAVFSTVGLTAAYATVVCWYPVLAARPGAKTGLPLAGIMNRWLGLWQKPALRFGLPILLAVISVPGFFQARFDDDIRQLQALSPVLQKQERTIQRITGIQGGQQMLLVTGPDEQTVLERMHSVGRGLENIQSLANFLPPESVQRENYERVKKLYAEQGTVLQETLGLTELPVLEDGFSPLTLSDFLASPVSEPFRFMWLGELEEGLLGSVILLNGAEKPAEQAGVFYLDRPAELSALFSAYRVRIAYLLLVATGAIWILLVVRYGFGKGTRMVVPPVLAGVFSISMVGISGGTLNIFNLLALAIVLGIGIDYTLFFAELGKERGTELLGTQLAVSLSAATTILSFGLLALSATRAIHSFGLTVLVGIFTCWLLAPLAMTGEKST